jgi:hypothetical protein
MTRKNVPIISITSIMLTAGYLGLSVRAAEAEEISFGIYPSVTKLIGQPGEVLMTDIIVKNEGENTLTLNLLLQPFTSSGTETGEVRFTQDSPEIFRSIQLIQDGEVVRELLLSPGQEQPLTLRIAIPKEEKPADYYFSVVLLSKSPENKPEITQEGINARSSITGGVAGHVLLAINPQTNQKMQLVEFSAPALSRSSQVPFHLRFANVGNHYLSTEGRIVIANVFGNTVEDMILPETVILSHSTKAITGKTPDILSGKGTPELYQEENLFPGIYRATLSAHDARKMNPIDKTIYFAVVPYEYLTIFIALIIFLLFIRQRMRKRFSR